MVYYRYDGSYEGFLCCVFERYLRKEEPSGIFSVKVEQMPLVPPRYIETNLLYAERVKTALINKISREAEQMIHLCFLCEKEEKELFLLRLICRFLRRGKAMLSDLGDEQVMEFYSLVRNLKGEAHLFKGFVRFSDCGDGLCAVIDPKNAVLPLLAVHFSKRLAGERFVIYDRIHHQLLLGNRGETHIIEEAEFDLPAASEEEKSFQEMWRKFYQTTAIKERRNERCRMNHMPKRFWHNMTELSEGTGKS